MTAGDSDRSRTVRVQYVPRGYGLALTILDQAELGDGLVQGDEALLTVVDGVTTLELPRSDGDRPAVLVWDESEVDWESLRAS